MVKSVFGEEAKRCCQWSLVVSKVRNSWTFSVAEAVWWPGVGVMSKPEQNSARQPALA